MSADNFNFIRKTCGRWRVWLNLSASAHYDEHLEQELRSRPDADGDFPSLEEAVAWANDQGYTEYGTQIDAPSRPTIKFEVP